MTCRHQCEARECRKQAYPCCVLLLLSVNSPSDSAGCQKCLRRDAREWDQSSRALLKIGRKKLRRCEEEFARCSQLGHRLPRPWTNWSPRTRLNRARYLPDCSRLQLSAITIRTSVSGRCADRFSFHIYFIFASGYALKKQSSRCRVESHIHHAGLKRTWCETLSLHSVRA